MIPGIVLGFGIGLAAYGCSKLLIGMISSEPVPDVSESRAFVDRSELVETSFPTEAVPEGPMQAQEIVEVALPEPQETVSDLPEETPEQHDEAAHGTAAANQDTDGKSWYVIATSKGKLRAIKCSSWTAHTVAGPFATKKEAQQAKQERE